MLKFFNMSFFKKKKVGLALGSGGGKGYAHIGVLKVLEENNIPIDFIAGSSAGALMGGLYSFFRDIKKVEEIVLSTPTHQLISLIEPAFFKGGMIDGKKIKDFVSTKINGASFDQLQIPFIAVATDFQNGKTVEIKKGDVASAIQASIAVPMLFSPVAFEGTFLCDGGASSPVPAKTVRDMGADIVIAVNLDNQSYFEKQKFTDNLYFAASRTIQILQYHLANESEKIADITIEPSVGDVGFMGLDRFISGKGKEIILEGQISTEALLPRIKKLIK